MGPVSADLSMSPDDEDDEDDASPAAEPDEEDVDAAAAADWSDIDWWLVRYISFNIRLELLNLDLFYSI